MKTISAAIAATCWWHRGTCPRTSPSSALRSAGRRKARMPPSSYAKDQGVFRRRRPQRHHRPGRRLRRDGDPHHGRARTMQASATSTRSSRTRRTRPQEAPDDGLHDVEPAAVRDRDEEFESGIKSIEEFRRAHFGRRAGNADNPSASGLRAQDLDMEAIEISNMAPNLQEPMLIKTRSMPRWSSTSRAISTYSPTGRTRKPTMTGGSSAITGWTSIPMA
jgi:hypothetical protein